VCCSDGRGEDPISLPKARGGAIPPPHVLRVETVFPQRQFTYITNSLVKTRDAHTSTVGDEYYVFVLQMNQWKIEETE
jgi:hypothetical protein